MSSNISYKSILILSVIKCSLFGLGTLLYYQLCADNKKGEVLRNEEAQQIVSEAMNNTEERKTYRLR